jgi:hypothetical protein
METLMAIIKTLIGGHDAYKKKEAILAQKG